MTVRTEVIQIRVTPDEKRQIERRAKKDKATVSQFIRKTLTTPEKATTAVPAVEPSAAEGLRTATGKPYPVISDSERSVASGTPPAVEPLADRREARARELARRMPLVNARQLAAREIPE